MTAVTARVAGVTTVVVASPRPAPATLAAAYLSDADFFLAVGGAQAIAAMAYGVGGVPPCDILVGPGNKWVTAAKSLVFGKCAIDMLAGPSECLVIADESANVDTIAADLLAQAEHDTAAVPILVTTSQAVIDGVNAAILKQLETLPTAATARVSVKNVRWVITCRLVMWLLCTATLIQGYELTGPLGYAAATVSFRALRCSAPTWTAAWLSRTCSHPSTLR